jgi:hypothetical protein
LSTPSTPTAAGSLTEPVPLLLEGELGSASPPAARIFLRLEPHRAHRVDGRRAGGRCRFACAPPPRPGRRPISHQLVEASRSSVTGLPLASRPGHTCHYVSLDPRGRPEILAGYAPSGGQVWPAQATRTAAACPSASKRSSTGKVRRQRDGYRWGQQRSQSHPPRHAHQVRAVSVEHPSQSRRRAPSEALRRLVARLPMLGPLRADGALRPHPDRQWMVALELDPVVTHPVGAVRRARASHVSPPPPLPPLPLGPTLDTHRGASTFISAGRSDSNARRRLAGDPAG